MAINTSVDSIIPADWHGFVEPFHKSGSDKKYHFSPGGKDMIREPRPGLNPTDIVTSNDTRLLVMKEGEPLSGFDFVTTDVLGILDLLQTQLNRTARFRKSDLGKRSLEARTVEMGILYPTTRINIETLLKKIDEMGLRLSDIGHLLMAAKMPVVHQAIVTRLRVQGIHEVVLGASSLNEEGRIPFQHEHKGPMPIAQLIYGRPGVVELDVTHPKPNGKGYEPHGSLWVVEKKEQQ